MDALLDYRRGEKLSTVAWSTNSPPRAMNNSPMKE